ncbi:Arginine N-methyltransferase 2 [Coniosporium tulheliwenetii]|uniref:Arginine N-methyltransferase 2 n=1 Tax=Coniosporium tulheliwenetii TaxID=3383036 RepID=A0ACC2ZNU9_9PEZI|nr:Arginine N-methyltransferase 2 [Cladosporium sp. JES 115]
MPELNGRDTTMDDPLNIETDLETQSLLLAAANHDTEALRNLLRTTSANDPAIVMSDGQIDGLENGHTNGAHAEAGDERKKELEAAARTVELLFQNGAIWNDLDKNNETPGCIAHRLGLKELYDMVVKAGVRAELLLNRLDEYQMLGDDDESEAEEDFEILEDPQETSIIDIEASDVNSAGYLASDLTFTADRLLDADKNGVMMAWETDIMRRTADRLLPAPSLRVLNIGHGMGIIDGIFQSKSPSAHHIVEAHPAVLERMRRDGWYDKPGVVVHEGKWQDVVPKLVQEDTMFDAIYFDTFAEDYKALKEFFSEYVIGLLDPSGGKEGEGGRFGFFNGLGADRQVVEIDLMEAGLETEWEEVRVPNLDEAGEWAGVRRRYWALDTYKLPTCKFIG